MSNIQEKSNFTYDPYAILQVESRSTLDQVKMAYKTLAKIFHPDRPTGHPEMFRMINEAYQQILKQYQDRPQNVQDLEKARADLKVTQRGTIDKKNFNIRKFNEQFLQQLDPQKDNVYDVDHHGSQKERSFSSYQAEQAQLSRDLEKMKPLFNRGQGFDPNVFNRLFVSLKQQNEPITVNQNLLEEQFSSLGLVDQAQLTDQQQLALAPHQQLTQAVTTLEGNQRYQYYQSPTLNEFQNPDPLTNDQYEYYHQQPDVTQIGAMSQQEANRRLAEYKSQMITIPQGGPDPRRPMDLMNQMHPSSNQNQNQVPMIDYLTYPASQENSSNYHQQYFEPDQYPESNNPTRYDQLADLRDRYASQLAQSSYSPTSSYPPAPSYPSVERERNTKHFDPTEFYEDHYPDQPTGEPESRRRTRSEHHHYQDDSNSSDQLSEMASELQRLKQQMAMQDRLLRKMHRRNKELTQSKN